LCLRGIHGKSYLNTKLKFICHETLNAVSCSKRKAMSNKTRSILKAIAVLLVLLAVLMELQIIIIPAIVAYKFWIVVIAFAVMLISTK
jgi:hypothetical protein